MKFDVVIGNPPFQDETIGTSDNPTYNDFMDESYKLAEKVILITPARFLFNAGKTPKSWNRKILSDKHMKVCFYEQQSKLVFPNTDIKGGVAITYRDAKKDFGMIGTFTQYKELNSIVSKVVNSNRFQSIVPMISTQNKFNLAELYLDFPDYKNIIGSLGKEKRLTTSIFEQLSVFNSNRTTSTDIEILGLVNLKRTIKYIDSKYIEDHKNLKKYKVILPKSNGTGVLGEKLSSPLVSKPNSGYTQSFISIGTFENIKEAEAALKYVKTKFLRVLLGTLKITQDNNKEVWSNIPEQNFSTNSDVDWAKNVAEIDQFLYAKYSFSKEEINFIEDKVKEMN